MARKVQLTWLPPYKASSAIGANDSVTNVNPQGETARGVDLEDAANVKCKVRSGKKLLSWRRRATFRDCARRLLSKPQKTGSSFAERTNSSPVGPSFDSKQPLCSLETLFKEIISFCFDSNMTIDVVGESATYPRDGSRIKN